MTESATMAKPAPAKPAPVKVKRPVGRPILVSLEQAIEAVQACNGFYYVAAKRLGLSPSGMLKLVKRHPELDAIRQQSRTINVHTARHTIVNLMETSPDERTQLSAAKHIDTHWHLPGESDPSTQAVAISSVAGMPADQVEMLDALQNGSDDERTEAIARNPALALALARGLGLTTARAALPPPEPKKPAKRKK